jgi:hypothetical protein
MTLVARSRIRRPLSYLARFRRRIQQLRPYPSLFVLMIPLTLVEPLKIAALLVVGKGHWLFGTAIIATAYGGSVLVVERLFRIVKPKLLLLRWFAATWAIVQTIRSVALVAFRSIWDARAERT